MSPGNISCLHCRAGSAPTTEASLTVPSVKTDNNQPADPEKILNIRFYFLSSIKNIPFVYNSSTSTNVQWASIHEWNINVTKNRIEQNIIIVFWLLSMLFSVFYLCQYKYGPQVNSGQSNYSWLTMKTLYLALGFSLLTFLQSRLVFDTRDLRKASYLLE